MNVFVVYAHCEPRSFNAMMKEAAVEFLSGAGHDIVVSDLYQMGFNPVAGRHDFACAEDPDYFDYQVEQRKAYQKSAMSADLRAEHEKLLWCELLILQFPLWWYGAPAILKGWIDRVMSVGFAYDNGMKFEAGGLRGRWGLVSTSTSADQSRYSAEGRHAYATIEETLRPINRGVFRYVGIEARPPFVAWAVNKASTERRNSYRAAYQEHLRRIVET